jgi:hypothetical protein
MYRQTYITTRPDTTAPFWLMSNSAPQGYFEYKMQYVQSGKILDYSSSISGDGLTFVAIMDFLDVASHDEVLAAYATQFPTALPDKRAYDTKNGHIRSITYSTV